MTHAVVVFMPVDEGETSSAAEEAHEEKLALFPLLHPGSDGDFAFSATG